MRADKSASRPAKQCLPRWREGRRRDIGGNAEGRRSKRGDNGTNRRHNSPPHPTPPAEGTQTNGCNGRSEGNGVETKSTDSTRGPTERARRMRSLLPPAGVSIPRRRRPDQTAPEPACGVHQRSGAANPRTRFVLVDGPWGGAATGPSPSGERVQS